MSVRLKRPGTADEGKTAIAAPGAASAAASAASAAASASGLQPNKKARTTRDSSPVAASTSSSSSSSAAAISSSAGPRPIVPSEAVSSWLTVPMVEKRMEAVKRCVSDFISIMQGQMPTGASVAAAVPLSPGPPIKKLSTVSQTRAEECISNSDFLLANIKKTPTFFAGAIGSAGTGRSKLTNTLLATQLHTARLHYRSVDVAAAQTLDDAERANAHDRFPTLSKRSFKHVTERPHLFIQRAGKIRVRRVVCKPSALSARVSKYADAEPDKERAIALQAQLEALDSVAAAATHFTHEVLYTGHYDNIWDDFKAAAETIAAAEQRCSWEVAPLLYSSWSYVEFSGPWDQLKKHQVWIDLPGLKDAEGGIMRDILTSEQARRLHLVFLLLLKARRLEPGDVDMLQPFIHRVLREVPLIVQLYPPGLRGNDFVVQEAKEAGGVKRLYDTPQGGAPDPLYAFFRDGLRAAAVDASICSELTGEFREYVFAHLVETQKLQGRSLTAIFYTPEQESMLRAAHLWSEGSDACAGLGAICSRIQLAALYYTHRRLLPVFAHLMCALQNTHSERALSARVLRVGFQPKDARSLIKQLHALPRFNRDGWRWKEDELPTVQCVSDDDKHEMHDALMELFEAVPEDKQDLQALLSQRFARMLGINSRNPSLEPSSDSEGVTLVSLLKPLLWTRTLRACLESVVAVTWLLRHHGEPPTEERMQQLFEEVDSKLELESQLELLRLARSRAGELSDDDEKSQPEEAHEMAPEIQGRLAPHGQLNPKELEQVQHNVIRDVFKRCEEATQLLLEGLSESEEVQQLFRKKLWEAWSKEQKLLPAMPLSAASAAAAAAAPGSNTKAAWVAVVMQHMDTAARVALDKLSRAKPKCNDAKLWLLQVSADKQDNPFREQYKEVLRGFAVTLDAHSSAELKRAAASLRLRVKAQLQHFVIPPPVQDNDILVAEHAPFLGAAVNILTSSRNVEGAHGLLQGPPVAAEVPPTAGTFDVVPVEFRLLSAVDPKHASTSPRLRNFISEPWVHPKRIFMQFKDEKPELRELSIYAYDAWRNDLLTCLHATQRKNKRGISPIFIPSLGRAIKTNMFARLRELKGPRGLELDQHPETVIYVMVEPQEWRTYAEQFADCPHITFVVLPAAEHGIRFARACIVYLATCMREAVRDECDLAYFHQLDDDWQEPRVFDAASFSTSCMRPTTLFVVLAFVEKVLRHEIDRNDDRDMLHSARQAELDQKHPEVSDLIDKTAGAIATAPDRRKFNTFFSDGNNVQRVLRDADRGLLEPGLAALTASVPAFKDTFLALLRRMRFSSGQVCQAAVTRKGITQRHNYNLHKIPSKEAGSPPAAAQARLETDGGGRFEYRWSTDRVGEHCHCLLTYLALRVNYLSTDEFFLSDAELVKLRLRDSSFFVDDRNFNKSVLAPRGYGGVLAFKVDMDFANISKGGIAKFKKKVKAKGAVLRAVTGNSEEESEDSDDQESDDEEGGEDNEDHEPRSISMAARKADGLVAMAD